MKSSYVRRRPVMNDQTFTTYLILFGIGYGAVCAFGFWWFQPSHISHNFTTPYQIFDILLFLLLSYVVWYQIANEFFSWFIAGFMKRPLYVAPQKGLKVAFTTAFVPGNEPYDMLDKTLKAMVNAHYKHDTWLLDEGNDPEAKRICKKYNVKHFSRKGIEHYNTSEGKYKARTKGGNYNAWFDTHGSKYDFIAQLDVDFIPKKNYLLRTLGYFHDPQVAFVGTPQIYGNLNASWIVRGAAEQAYNFYGSMQKGLFGLDMQLFIGANHVLRTAAHENIDGYSGHIVEDHLTGMKMYANKWKSVYVPERLAVGEGPSTWDGYFSQQMRWAYGLIDILFNHSSKIFPRMRRIHIVNYFWLQQFYFYGLAQIIGIALLVLYFFFGIQSTNMQLYPLLVLYIPLLVFQQIFFIWLQKFNISPRRERGFMMLAKILNWAVWPVYFLALTGVIMKKKLNYVVTPKGVDTKDHSRIDLFIPHAVLGTTTLACVAVAPITHHDAPQLLFWAAVNTIAMYSFIMVEGYKSFKKSLQSLLRMRYSFKLLT